MKRIAILPTLCTLGNAVCGFGSLLFAAQMSIGGTVGSEHLALYISGWLIFAAMIFDVLDGYVARRTKSDSQFGAQLDSLCDAVSFGVAPAFLLIQLGSGFEGRLVRDGFLVAATLYLVCVILRLARFNVQTTLDPKTHRIFCGLPSPAAAGCLASLVVLRYNFSDPRTVPDAVMNPILDAAAPLCAVVVALLMISRIPYPHLAHRVLRRRQTFARLVQFVLAVAVLVLLRELGLLLLFWLYALVSPVQFLWNRSAWVIPGETPEANPATVEH